jgi:hypothetical protein
MVDPGDTVRRRVQTGCRPECQCRGPLAASDSVSRRVKVTAQPVTVIACLGCHGPTPWPQVVTVYDRAATGPPSPGPGPGRTWASRRARLQVYTAQARPGPRPVPAAAAANRRARACDHHDDSVRDPASHHDDRRFSDRLS